MKYSFLGKLELEIYADIDGDSGVRAYEIGQSRIVVQFKNGSTYEYTAISAGQQNIDQMARLARLGNGLNAFINSVVRNKYSRKIS